MKLILTFLLMLLAVTPASEKLEEFNSSINDGYSKYEVIEDKNNNYYSFKVIQGINKDKMNYGVFLFNDKSKSHKLIIETNNKTFNPEPNSRGDYMFPAIEFSGDVKIYVTDDKNNYSPFILLESISVEDFNSEFVNIIVGNNQGLNAVKLKSNLKFDLFTMLTYIFVVFIIIFGGLIMYMLFAKKGIFSPKNRKSDVFNYREYINNLPQQETYDNNIVLDESDYVAPDDVNEGVAEDIAEEAPVINMYPYLREYDDDDDDFVKTLLTEKGYVIEYSKLEEDEKNLIMLELMKMRDGKEINREQYQNEIIDLWKK